MKKRKVLPERVMPPRLATPFYAILWLYMDRYQPAGWVWGVVGTIGAVLLALNVFDLLNTEEIESAPHPIHFRGASMKSTNSLLAAAVAVCLSQAAFASAPATHTEVMQPEQLVAKGKKPKAAKSVKQPKTAKG
jgi:hypothetical protein